MATRIPSWLGGVVALALAIGIVALIVRASDPEPSRRPAAVASAGPEAAPVRPARPPGPNDPKAARPPEPALPVLSPAEKRALAERVKGAPHPGEAAFRAVSDRYVDENLGMAERQAAAEGLTLAEVRELTYFGLMVLATQRVTDVEELAGHALTEAQRGELAGLMQSSNGEFRDAMRALVARGGPEADRWALIRATEARYRSELFRITGLDDERLDDLLAGNIALPGAPARGDEPTGAPAAGPRDDVAPPARPAH